MLKIIIILIIGAGVGWFLKSRLDSRRRGNDAVNNPNFEKIEKKRENLDKVLEMARERGEIANDDVERELGVSDVYPAN